MHIQLKNLSLPKKTLLASALSMAACQVNAAGFQLNAQSATGLGRAFAGDAVIADNASVMSRNAAAMALFDKTALSLGANVIKTDISVSDGEYTVPALSSSDSSNYDQAGGTSVAPNIHLIVPLDDKFAVGADLYTNFGTRTDFDSSFAGSEYGGVTDIKSFNLGLVASYRLTPQWSIGGGLDIVYGLGELKREFSSDVSNLPFIGETTALDAEVSGVGYGFNLGTVFELNSNNRFGLSYHYSPELEVKGDVTKFDDNIMTTTTAKNDSLYLNLPDIIEFSGYHRLEATPYAVHYSVQWIGWSSFDTLESDAYGTIETYDWQDAMHFSLGGTYYLNNKWTLRAGYMYDTSAQDEITSISVPDSDRQWFSTGFTYQFSEQSNIDFGFTYLIGQDVTVYEETGTLSSITGTTRADAILVAMQYSHEF